MQKVKPNGNSFSFNPRYDKLDEELIVDAFSVKLVSIFTLLQQFRDPLTDGSGVEMKNNLDRYYLMFLIRIMFKIVCRSKSIAKSIAKYFSTYLY